MLKETTQYETSRAEGPRSIAIQSNVLDENVGLIIDALTVLETRLSSVILPPNPIGSSDSVETVVPHANFLATTNSRLQYVLDSIRELTARVEL